MLSGAEGWEDIEQLGASKEAWLRQFLRLENGIPSHDTLRRVFSLLDAPAFQERFIRWVEGVFSVTRGQVVAMDGKTLRGSRDEGQGRNALHLVRAWASENAGLVGQRAVDEKSTEITAIPLRLEQLYLAGCSVTIDAMGCQKDIARTIVEQKADAVSALKGNQGQLYEDVQDWFKWAQQSSFKDRPYSFWPTVNKAHGRLEIRRCWTLSDPRAFDVIRHPDGWVGLPSIAMLQRERHIDGHIQTVTAYGITRRPADAKLILPAVRAHGSIENTFPWTLDVPFREDDARLRSGDRAENFAVLRPVAFNLLKRHPAKLSLKRKRFKAALDDSFLLALFSQVCCVCPAP